VIVVSPPVAQLVLDVVLITVPPLDSVHVMEVEELMEELSEQGSVVVVEDSSISLLQLVLEDKFPEPELEGEAVVEVAVIGQ